MFNSFPYDKWSEDIAEFWTWGGANSTGTYILTVLGIIFMVVALIGFVTMENAKLEHQAAALRGSGALGPVEPTPPQAA
jgi:hypothetical protein